MEMERRDGKGIGIKSGGKGKNKEGQIMNGHVCSA